MSAMKATIHAVLQDKHACVTCDTADLANKISYLRLPGYKVLAQNTQVERKEEENRTDKRNEPSRYVYSSRFCDCKCYVCLGHVQAILSGVKLRWASGKHISKTQSVSFYPVTDEKKYYKLTFHKRHRQLILGDYLNHVLKEGNEIKVRNRQRKLYTNSGSYWRHVVFQHPASFETLAMEAERKQEIVDDLVIFSKAEDFYARIGRAWKRGYLLFGPPGTGKSTMIAAMANLLNYDIYDLELTAVKDNTELRKLLIETTTRSIIVIEDIDCSLDLTGQRKKKKEEEGERDEKDPKPKLPKEEDSKQSQELLGETKMTPAEVAEHLMPKTISGDATVCLEGLIGALEKAKEDAILKAEEEAKEKEKESARLKAEEEAKEKEKEKVKAEEEAKEKAKAAEEAKEKDSSAAENAKKKVKDNGFCDNGNGELDNKENKQEGFSH
ncbi:hypothetical protein D5086_032997 [Populus alba]|uniref:Uncharacterized protein n=1 Tax=Populus alba TaxID=43335 RepID=A0ACC4AFK3_POPAL